MAQDGWRMVMMIGGWNEIFRPLSQNWKFSFASRADAMSVFQKRVAHIPWSSKLWLFDFIDHFWYDRSSTRTLLFIGSNIWKKRKLKNATYNKVATCVVVGGRAIMLLCVVCLLTLTFMKVEWLESMREPCSSNFTVYWTEHIFGNGMQRVVPYTIHIRTLHQNSKKRQTMCVREDIAPRKPLYMWVKLCWWVLLLVKVAGRIVWSAEMVAVVADVGTADEAAAGVINVASLLRSPLLPGLNARSASEMAKNREHHHLSGHRRNTRYISPQVHAQTNFSPTVAQDLSKSTIWYS